MMKNRESKQRSVAVTNKLDTHVLIRVAFNETFVYVSDRFYYLEYT